MAYAAIIADDLTGACDTGVKLVGGGYRARVVVDAGACGSLEREPPCILSVNTETRNVDPEQAYARVRQTAEALSEAGVRWFYKKVDSVLRGNTGRELDAMLDALRCEMAVVAPAFPDNHRTVQNGQMVLGDAADTRFSALEALQGTAKSRCAHIPLEAVREGPGALALALESARNRGVRIALLDSETNEDLGQIAEAMKHLPFAVLPAGSAGFISQMGGFPDDCKAAGFTRETVEAGSGVLVVVGTRHPVTVAQLARLKQDDTVAFAALDVDGLSAQTLPARVEEALESLNTCGDLSRKTGLVVTTRRILGGVGPEEFRPNEEVFDSLISEAVAQLAERVLERHRITRIIVTGGATASALFQRLGVDRLELVGEPSPGIVTSYIQIEHQQLYVSTKSGGFGDSEALRELVGYMGKLNLMKEKERVLC